MKYSRPTQKKHTNGTLSQKGENSASTSTTQIVEKGENGSRKMSESIKTDETTHRAEQQEIGCETKNRTAKERQRRGKDSVQTWNKLGKDPEVVFARIITPPQKKKDKAHATYVSISVKLPAQNKVINIKTHHGK